LSVQQRPVQLSVEVRPIGRFSHESSFSLSKKKEGRQQGV